MERLRILLSLLALATAVVASGCHGDRRDDEGPMENAGEAVDEAAEDTGEAVEEVSDDVDDTFDDEPDDD